MVRTGRRAARLASLLKAAGLRPDDVPPRGPRIEDLGEPATARVLDVYHALGGHLEHPVLRPGAWDLSFDGIVIELDEELHFNRYREATLHQHWAYALPWTASYLEFSRAGEQRCLKGGRWGARWSTSSSSLMFGPPSSPGDFEGGGSPRWKQRALYDVMKDAVAADAGGTRVARVSIYDQVNDRVLGDVLEGRRTAESDDLLALLSSRTS